jgi:rhomboid protease GluP
VIEADVEVYRSSSRRACEERALVLGAVGIATAMVLRAEEYRLEVPPAEAPRARAQLAQYEAENLPTRPRGRVARLYPKAWVGCLFYAAWLLGVPLAITDGLVRLDAFQTGELYGARVQGGQWWRAWTALTLHVSGPHLAANLGAGLWFGYLAGRKIGVGVAWFLIVLGAGLANLVEALIGPQWHRSVGASTAVFTALGIMAAHTWRERLDLPQSRIRRWGPLTAGLALLGWLGTAGKHTDVIAHALGFAVGALLGWAAALPRLDQRLQRIPQWPAGIAAMAVMMLAWSLALAS